MKLISIWSLLLLLWLPVGAEGQVRLQRTFSWSEEQLPESRPGTGAIQRLHFSGAVASDEHPHLPFALHTFPVQGPGVLRVEVEQARFEPFDRQPVPGDSLLASRLVFQTGVFRQGNRYVGKVAYVPLIVDGRQYQRSVSVVLRVYHEASPRPVRYRSPQFAGNSVLSQGRTFKIAVAETGIHRLSYTFLREELGIDIDNVDPREIRLFGNRGGMLPTSTQAERQDDLVENALWVSGAADGRFDPADQILFYAEGPDRWDYDDSRQQFVMQKNLYDTRNYYFLQIGTGAGLRMNEQSHLTNTAAAVTSFDDYARFEEDRLNLLHEWPSLAQGSGQRWYSDPFRNARSREYNGLFRFSDRLEEQPVQVLAEMALRAETPSRFSLTINGERLSSSTARRVWSLTGPTANEVNYADSALVDASVIVSGQTFDLTVAYDYPSGPGDGSEGWLDYIQVQVRRSLRMRGDALAFRDLRSLVYPSATFVLAEASPDVLVWDITDPQKPRLQEVERLDNGLRFGISTSSLREFIALRPGGTFPSPEAIGEIPPQNLHSTGRADLLVVYHSEFREAAERLAQHRRQFSGLEVATADIEQVFHEFSSGRRDPSAVRDFALMLHQRDPAFAYLLLLGDGSFDNRDIYGLGTNFLPVYQTRSFNPIYAYPSDDYFAILDDQGKDPLEGDLSIACGRLPVKTADEAGQLVDKIMAYDLNLAGQRNWRNTLVFLGDDEDNMTHTRQADQIADTLLNRYAYFNVDKLYLDAFPQVSTAGGNRVPGLTEALNRAIFQGSLVTTYLGHGGAQGWAQERVLSIPDIRAWSNADRPTILLTATCQFAGFDDPSFVTAGEEALLNPRGGAIALFTTVRAVFSSYNRELTELALQTMMQRPDGTVQTMGEIMQRAKNQFTFPGQITNARKFALLGDPSQRPALPGYAIRTTTLNGAPANEGIVDTLKALQRVQVSGEVTDLQGRLLEDFNGIVYPAIYDKAVELQTLGQDRGSYPYPYSLQKNIVFRGRASVQNGKFDFTFVVPKDINFDLGRGKISYYAASGNNRTDATGAFEGFRIGGISQDGLADQEGPRVDVYMNSDGFVFGGITNASPTLLVELEDENGINVVGNSIGHDLEAVLDEDTQNAILLNDFYESELDDYQRGTVRYPLNELAEGRHSLRVKAWDVANNPSEGYTEFVVAASEGIALRHVLNYPNPFTDQTCFQFDHNLPGQELEVLVQIYTISGRLVKTLEAQLFSDGALRRDDCISWDGRDDFGDRLARGVYLYRVQVRALQAGSGTLEGESDFEKLVILK